MAFSMFVRNTATMNRLASLQLRKLATQPALVHRAFTNTMPATCIKLQDYQQKPATSMPLVNATREFSTTPARMGDAKSDHSRVWVMERGVSVALVAALPLALAFPSKIFDSILAVLVTAHSFWGLEAIAVDYVRESIFGSFIPKVAVGLVYLLSIATLGGLFYIISHDIGIANFIRQLWSIKSNEKA